MDHANVALIKAIVDRDSAHGTRQAFD